MVFFNCNACGESLKKNQVEKHCFRCRGCQSLSCVDCGKDFWGNAYAEHTKCISEEEKYSGKDYKPKASANKGERKQEAWVEQVQSAIDKARTNPKLRSVLLQIKDCSNIPRKKAKFENFLRNSMRIHDSAIITQSWELISAEMHAQKEVNGAAATTEVKQSAGQGEAQESQVEEATERKLNKRERKEERQKKTSKKEKKNKDSQKNGDMEERSDDNEEGEPSHKKKKSKKRKHEDVEEAPEESVGKKKSKKRKHEEREPVEQEVEEEAPEPATKKSKHKKEAETSQEEEAAEPAGKFRWEDTILQCLQAANDKQLSLKKLKKKVMAQFWSQGGDQRLQTEEKALAKFHKKVSKNPRFKVSKDSVKLVE